MKILFPHDEFLHGKILPHNPSPKPSPPPPQHEKGPLKMSVHFPMTHTIGKQWSRFLTCSPFPGDCWVLSRHKRHNY